MITTAELNTLIKGDNTDLKRKLAESRADIRAFASEATSALTGAFTPASQAVTTFANNTAANMRSVGVSLTNVEQAASSMSGTAGSAFTLVGQQMGGVSAASAGMAQAVQSGASTAANSAQAMSASLGAAAGSAGQAAAAIGQTGAAAQQAGQGLAGVSANAGQAAAGISGVASASQGAGQTLQQLQATFKANESAIVSLGSQIADNRQKMAGLAQEMTTLAQAGQKNSDQYRALQGQYQSLGAATRVLSAEQGAYRAAQSVVMQSTDALSEKTGFLTKLFGSKTHMVATAGTVFMGYDRILQTALASMGGVSLATSLLITAFGFLIPKIMQANSETEKKVALDKEQIIQNELLHNSLQTGRLFTQEYAEVLHARNALTTDLKTSLGALRLAQLEETDAVRGSSTATRDAAEGISDARLKVGLYVMSLFESVKTERDAVAARLEATKTLNEQVEARIKLAAATGQTANALLAELGPILQNTNAWYSLVNAINAGAFAQAQFRAGQNALSMARTKVAVEAAQAGVDISKNHAEATRRLNVELTKQGEETYKLAQVTLAAEKNMRGFTEATHKAAGGGSRAAVSSFAVAITGLDDALKKVNANADKLGNLFDPMTKKSRAGAQELKSALDEVAKSVNEFLSTAGVKAKVTAADLADNWQRFQGVVAKTEVFDDLKNAINSINLDRVVAGMDSLDESMRVSQGSILLNAQTLQAVNEKLPGLAANAQKAGLAFEGMVLPMANQAKVIAAGFSLIEGRFGPLRQSLDDLAFSTKENLAKAGQSWDEFVANLPIVQFKQAIKEMKDALNSDPLFNAVKLENEAAQAVAGIIREFEEQGERMGLTGQKLMQHVLDGLATKAPEFTGKMKTVADQVVEQWKRAAERLPGIWESVLHDLDSQTRHDMNLIFNVIGDMPGKVGESLRKAQSEFEKWMKFLDSAVRLIQRLMGDTESGLTGLFNSILGFFKKTQTATQVSTTGITDSIGLIIKNFGTSGGGTGTLVGTVTEGSAQAAGALGQLGQQGAASMGGLASATSAAGNVIGGVFSALTQAVGVFASTFHDDSRAVRFAGGFLLGGPIGGTLAAIFGGPSKYEREKRALELEKMRLENKSLAEGVKKLVEETNQAILETIAKGQQVLEGILGYSAVPKATMQRFFKDLTRVFALFVEMAKQFKADALESAKVLADAMGPVMDAIGAAVGAIDGINSFIAPAERIVDSFFASLTVVFNRFGVLAESVPKELQKHARKFAVRMKDVVDVIATAVFAFLGSRGKGAESTPGLIDLKEIPAQAFEFLKQGLALAAVKMGEIADSIDAGLVKRASRFAERVGSVTGILKESVEGLGAVAGLSSIPAAAFSLLQEGIKGAITVFLTLADTLSTDLLGRAVVIAQSVEPIASAIKAWVEAAGAAKGYSEVAEQTWQSIVADLKRAIDLMRFMLASAIDFLPDAVKLEDVMRQIAGHAIAALGYAGQALSASASAFGGIVGAISGGPTAGVFPGGEDGELGASSFAASSYGTLAVRASAPAAGSSSVTFASGSMPVTIVLPPGSTEGDGEMARRIFREEIAAWWHQFRMASSM